MSDPPLIGLGRAPQERLLFEASVAVVDEANLPDVGGLVVNLVGDVMEHRAGGADAGRIKQLQRGPQAITAQ